MRRLIEDIISDFNNENFHFSHHAFIKSIERQINIDEIIECTENMEIIEDYPDDKYSPSCLLLGFTKIGKPLHIQITSDSSIKMKIITIYEPDPNIWFSDFKTRRNND